MQTHQRIESRLAEKYRGAADEDDPGVAMSKSSDDDSDSRAPRRTKQNEVVANLKGMN